MSKFAGEYMIKNLSQLRPVKFLGLVSVKQNDSSFKHFWTNVRKLARESMLKTLSQLRPVKFLGLVSVKQIT